MICPPYGSPSDEGDYVPCSTPSRIGNTCKILDCGEGDMISIGSTKRQSAKRVHEHTGTLVEERIQETQWQEHSIHRTGSLKKSLKLAERLLALAA